MSRRFEHFGLLPRHRLYGVFERPEQISVLREAVAALGVTSEYLHVLKGPDGILQLNSRGKRGGLLARLVRGAQGMTDETREITKYREALHRDRLVVLVDIPRDDARVKEELRVAF